MFKHILIPLDGSKLAESVVPTAAGLAEALKSQITLIHIIEEDAKDIVHGERHLTRPEEADAYLKEVEQQYFSSSIKVNRHVHTAAMKNISKGIVMHQAEFSPDLVLMCTHGHGGLREMLFGSIAQQVIASGTIPVLLIRPEAAVSANRGFTCQTLLAPTDAEPSHDPGMEIAFGLALAVHAELVLLTVVPTLGTLTGKRATTGRFMPGTTKALLQLEESDLKEFLQNSISRYREAGVHASGRLEHGDPAAVIADVAEQMDADIIVLGTHGKTGTKAFWSQSIGARVMSLTQRPILLVPV